MRNPALAAVLLVAIVASCGGGAGDASSEGCLTDPDCPDGGVCYRGLCLDPLSDDDDDGLPNEVERLLTLDPFSPDTDADGLPDAVEVGDWAEPADADADGVLDALEHGLVDADRDCLPAPLDADESAVETDPQVLVAFLCRHVGACAAAGAAVAIRCVEGSHACDYGLVEGFEDVETSCDGRDNDCDGQTDEGATWRGLPPGDACRGEGACGWGTVECRDDGRVVCSSNPDGSTPGAATELCNGQDDDCDGQTDEEALYHGLALGLPCDGTGACAAGVVECRPDGSATCSSNPDGSAPQAIVEACNGQDDDCDGQTDEELVGSVIDRCPLGGVCAAAFSSLDVACVDGHWACDLSGVDDYEPAPEASCDGQDNDCDGLTDEDLVAAAVPCPSAGVCAPYPPSATCVAAEWQCRFDGIPGFEPLEATCDDQDNDCDGWTDDGLPTALDAAWRPSTLPSDGAWPLDAWRGTLVALDADQCVVVLAGGTLYTADEAAGAWSPGWTLPEAVDDPPDWMGVAKNGLHLAWTDASGAEGPATRVVRVEPPGTGGAPQLVTVAWRAPGAVLFALGSREGAWQVQADGDQVGVVQWLQPDVTGLGATLPDPTGEGRVRRPVVARGDLVHLVGPTDVLAWDPAAPTGVTTSPLGGDAGEVTAAWRDDAPARVLLKSATSPTGWFVSEGGVLAVLDAGAPFDVTRVLAANAAWDGPHRRLLHVGSRDATGELVPGMFQLRALCP